MTPASLRMNADEPILSRREAGAKRLGSSDYLLRVQGVSKSFGVVKALKGVDLELRAGSVHAVIGHNGAGKSTLMNILSGVHTPDSGRILLRGQPISLASPHDAFDQGITMVHQELAIVPDLDVSENIFLGREPLLGGGLLRRDQMEREAARVLGDLGLHIPVRTLCSKLSVGVRQMIEIARAVSRESLVLILDEPTSALSESEQSRLFALIAQLRARGIGILYISHKLDEVQALSDTITVMRDGSRVATVPSHTLDSARMIEMMVGHVITQQPPAAAPQNEIGLELRGVTAAAAGIHEVSFSARRGEIIGLAGMLGSGRTELFEILFGVRRFEQGSIHVRSKEVRPRSPIVAMESGIVLVPEDRRNQGIFAELPVWKNAVLASFYDLFRAALGFVREDEARRASSQAVQQFRIATPSIDQEIRLLSGGNQQKVILARWLLRRPTVLLLDDPTAGIDVGAKDEIHSLIRTLAGEGLTVIISSSEFPELLDLCHRILVIKGGRIVWEADPRTVTEAQLVHAASASEQVAP